MSHRTDAALAVIVLFAAWAAFVLVEASVSVSAAVLGCLGTVAFEVVAARNPEPIRRRWESRPVQVAAVVTALATIVGGATVAPSHVLSAVSGALTTYLVFLALVTVRRSRTSSQS
ncbi:hypothetical protein [Natrarchaeobius chitinivorans]|uniref:Uncharacterized protein n=1 Tax=Natrarchaeobius chitinivorans TaxID=1679083 RepID=A0A3N6LR89_NATCH|nr:hypothetical protein [Natrarchaeobius chitinivorans]RQG92218.1 hypothetical protein EA473_17030 [Natrarchaeobius chitinivorans]